VIRAALVRVFALHKVLVLLCVWVPVYALFSVLDVSITIANIATLIGLFVGCVGVAAVDIASSPSRLWYPMTWFLLTSGIYYGFGPLLYYFGTPETVAYVNVYYPVTDGTLWRSNVLTLIGIGGVIAVYLLLNIVFGNRSGKPEYRSMRESVFDSHFLWKVSLIFMAVGVPVKLFLVLPRALGLWDVVLPGSVEYFAVLSTLALVPLFLLRARRGAWAATAVFLLLCFEVSTAFVQLSKLAILKLAIVCVLAWVLRGTTAKRLMWIGALSFLTYALVLEPLVTYGRIAFNIMGLRTASEATTLTQDVASGSARDELAALLPGVQGWWSRLNYANAQAFAMDAHDEGQRGDTFELAVWTFVPRVLYPDKPITTTGEKFNVLVTGNPESKSAPGMFAEGYWNAGWAGLIIVFVVMACCYWGWERYTQAHLRKLGLQYLPVMWMGLLPAMQQDSWFVPGTLGILPLAIAFHWLARTVVLPPMRVRRRQNVPQMGPSR
jgi:hypothetical protein